MGDICGLCFFADFGASQSDLYGFGGRAWGFTGSKYVVEIICAVREYNSRSILLDPLYF